MMSDTTTPNAVAVKNVYRRQEPETDTNDLGYHRKGQTLAVTGLYEGLDIDGNDIWYKLSDGTYAWSGGIEITDASKLVNEPVVKGKVKRKIKAAFGKNVLSEVTPKVSSAQKQVILNADDYGLCEEIDRAVEYAVSENVINSVACYVTFPEREKDDDNNYDAYAGSFKKIQQLQKLKAVNPQLSIGLHFSMTAGQPLSNLNEKDFLIEIDNVKWFSDISDQRTGNVIRGIGLLELDIEIRSQLERLGSALGSVANIEHISCHHNIIFYVDRFYEVLLDVLKTPKYSHIAIRSPLMWSNSGLVYDSEGRLPIKQKGFQHGGNSFKNKGFTLKDTTSLVRVAFNTTVKSQLKSCGLAIDQCTRFPYCFNDTIYGRPDVDRLKRLFLQVRGDAPVEFMLHLADFKEWKVPDIPGIDKDYTDIRKEEFKMITAKDPDTGEYLVKQWLKLYNIDMTPFRDIRHYSRVEIANNYAATDL